MKKFLFMLIGVALTAATAWSQVYGIDIKKLPADSAYQKRIAEFMPLRRFVAAWTPEWQAAIPKARVVAMIERLLKETKDFIAKDKSGNVDLLLFQALLKTSLYNADFPAYHDEIVKDLTAVKGRFPKDYRAYWLLANHYGSADKPFAAVREYGVMFSEVSDGKPLPNVMGDYITVCFYTMMYSRSRLIMDEAARSQKTADPRTLFPIYGVVTEQLKEPPVKHAFPNNLVYTAQQREYEFGYLSRILGIWIPLKDVWKPGAFELTADGFTSFNILIPGKNAAGKDASTDITIVLQALPQESFDQWIGKALARFESKNLTSEWKGRWPATVYEYRDPTTFEADGGGRGCIVFVKRGQPEIKGLAIEAPAIFPIEKGKDNVGTVVLKEGYTRFDGDIYYAFMFIAAEGDFAATKKEFFEFMDRVLLD